MADNKHKHHIIYHRMISLVDNNKNPYGHSVVYRQSLLQIKNTKHLDIDVNINKKYRFDSTFWRTFFCIT